MKSICNFLILYFFLSTTVSYAQTQEFPGTEKEVTEILCTGKWTLKSLGKGEKIIPAEQAGMEFLIVFSNDGTYKMTMFGNDRMGKWVPDMAGKQVKIYEKKEKPESLIKGIKKGQLLFESADDDGLKMIFESAK